jgi:hypothetical protein
VEVKGMVPGADLPERAPWIRVQHLQSSVAPILPAFLGPGEVEAISLATDTFSVRRSSTRYGVRPGSSAALQPTRHKHHSAVKRRESLETLNIER